MVTQTLDFDLVAEKLGASVSYEDHGVFRIYRLEWENGDYATIYRNGDWLHWDWLQTDGEGRYHDLMSAAPLFTEQGITHYSSNVGGPSTDALLKTGFEHAGGYLLYDIEQDRHAEYRAWKAGKTPEPDWRSSASRQEQHLRPS